MLIEAARAIFGGRQDRRTYTALSSQDICKALNADDELPFGAYSAGAGIAPRDLAKLLRPYRIKSKKVRVGGETLQGYRRDQFTEVWERYTRDADPSGDPEHPEHPEHPNADGGFGVPDMPDVPEQPQLPERENAHEHGDVPDVPDVPPFRRPSLHARVPSNGAGPERGEATCGIPAHRDSDWAFPTGEIWVCGICHPPVAQNVVHRNGTEANT